MSHFVKQLGIGTHEFMTHLSHVLEKNEKRRSNDIKKKRVITTGITLT